MGFLHDLGLDELIDGINEFKNEMSGLKDDLLGGVTEGIVNPIKDQVADAQGSIQQIVSDTKDAGSSAVSNISDTISGRDSK